MKNTKNTIFYHKLLNLIKKYGTVFAHSEGQFPMTRQSPLSLKAGSLILKQGDRGESAYIIEKGRVEIFIETDFTDEQGHPAIHLVGTRGAGAMIGEMAIIDNAPRTASIRALEDCELLEITREDFTRRLEQSDPVLRMAMQVILTRYRDLLGRVDLSQKPPMRSEAEILEKTYAEHSDVQEMIKLSNDFESALESIHSVSPQLSLHYQPILNLKHGTIEGFEALMRWNHPERGPISPALFIPLIEECGIIVKASQWALKESLQALKRMEDFTHHNELFMSVNFSSNDFSKADFVESLYNTLSQCDIPTARVHLEITERLLMGQPENARNTLNMCRKAGLGISIDDFGTGYSSLSYLHYFPIDTLKIDRSFVKDMAADHNALELVKSVISLGQNLKLKIIAEGIETREEAKILKELGCEMGQGYYFSRPLPEKDILTYLKNNAKPEI